MSNNNKQMSSENQNTAQMGSSDQETTQPRNLTYSGFYDDDTLFGSTPYKFKTSPFMPKLEKDETFEIPFHPEFQRKGSSIAKYHPTNGCESNGNDGTNELIHYHSITAMTEYGQKSFEEIRFEDFIDKQIINDSCKIISDILINHFNQSNDSGFNDSTDVIMEKKSFDVNPSLTNVFFEKGINQDEGNIFGDAVKSAIDIKFEHKKAVAVKYQSIMNTNDMEIHNCITSMEEYEGKSIEEIRFEDYELRRRILWGLE